MYKVDKILQKRLVHNKPEYLVKWEGWPVQQSTWEPIKNLSYIKDLVDDFEKKQDSNNPKPTAESAKKRGRKRRAEEEESDGEDRSKNKSSHKIRKMRGEVQKKEKRKSKESQIEVLESEEEDKGVEILGLKKENNAISFYVRMNGNEVWVERNFLVRNYADEICKFYEDRIVFDP